VSDQIDLSASHARLQETVAGRCFTSDLSVNEFLLVTETGFEPLGLVVGSSIYHIGLQVARWGKSQELNVLTAAMYNARELAMRRMEAEATELGADGIVGVRIEMKMYAWGESVAEFVAIGTAVRSTTHPGEYRAPNGRPFTSDLTGQELYTLCRARPGTSRPRLGRARHRVPRPGHRGAGPRCEGAAAAAAPAPARAVLL